MKSFKLLACLIIALNLCHAIFAKSYKDHKVVSFTIDNEEQLKEIQSLEANSGVNHVQLFLNDFHNEC